jgi:molybdate transport system ATP-binding protein
LANVQLRHHHKLTVKARIGALALDIDLNLSAQWTLLFGPSGSGKSSLLRAACGLLDGNDISFSRREPDDHWVALEHTPSHRRGLSWAPQNASLFPHLNVRDNITFAARCAGNTGTENQALIADSMHLFRIGDLASRMPRDLSGGERQRVSLARAFATPNCQLMLLDEPFNGIDRTLRDELLPEMRAWCRDRDIPVLSVSHDVEEALQLQAEVVLIRDGRVEAQGYVTKVLQTERARLLRSLSEPH